MMISGSEPLGLKLRYLTALHGVTPYQIYKDHPGLISGQTMYRWYDGRYSPPADKLIKIGNICGFTCAETLFLWGRADIETTREELSRALKRSPCEIRKATYKVVIK